MTTAFVSALTGIPVKAHVARRACDLDAVLGGPGGYAVIDIDPGYQKLCGSDALDYVRYRHLDNDLIRAARQQSFLGEAKNQIGVGSVFSDRKELLKIFGSSVRTDIESNSAILSLLRLVGGRREAADPGRAAPPGGS